MTFLTMSESKGPLGTAPDYCLERSTNILRIDFTDYRTDDWPILYAVWSSCRFCSSSLLVLSLVFLSFLVIIVSRSDLCYYWTRYWFYAILSI